MPYAPSPEYTTIPLHIPLQVHSRHQHSRRPLGRGQVKGQTVAWVVEWTMVNCQIFRPYSLLDDRLRVRVRLSRYEHQEM